MGDETYQNPYFPIDVYILIHTSRTSEHKVPIASDALNSLESSDSNDVFGLGSMFVLLKLLR